jgi:hypothetical protein
LKQMAEGHLVMPVFLTWNVSGYVRDLAIGVSDLVNGAVVICYDGALVALRPSVGAGIGALGIAIRRQGLTCGIPCCSAHLAKVCHCSLWTDAASDASIEHCMRTKSDTQAFGGGKACQQPVSVICQLHGGKSNASSQQTGTDG